MKGKLVFSGRSQSKMAAELAAKKKQADNSGKKGQQKQKGKK